MSSSPDDPIGETHSNLSAFISYARHDEVFARQLGASLATRGVTIRADWLLQPGPDYRDQLQRQILLADVFIAILTPQSVSSEECATEVQLAHTLAKRILPVLHRDVTNASTLAACLRTPQWAYIRELPTDEDALSSLHAAMRTNFSLLQMHTFLLDRADDWNRAGRPSSRLLRGEALAPAEDWLPRAADPALLPDPTALQYEYLLASRRNRTRAVRIMAALALAIGTALSVAAAVAWHNANTARTAALVRTAASLIEADPSAAALVLMTLRDDRAPAGGLAVIARVANAPLATMLEGHGNHVVSASFNCDGTAIVTAAWDGTARIWPSDGRGTPRTLTGDKWVMHFAQFSPDCRYVLAGSRGGTVRIWHVDGTDSPIVLATEKELSSASFSPDASHVLTTHSDGSRIWSLTSPEARPRLLPSDKTVEWGTFSPDGTKVATAGWDNVVRIWAVEGDGKPIELRGHEHPVHRVSFSRDGTRVLSTSTDATARVWSTDGRGRHVVLGKSTGPDQEDLGGAATAAFSGDSTRVVTGSSDGVVRIWRLDQPQDPVILPGHRGRVSSVSFSHDDTLVVTTMR